MKIFKILFPFILLFLLSDHSMAQEPNAPINNSEKTLKDSCDNIILRSGEEISSKVMEVGVTEIKYRKCPKASGPSYSVLKSDVFMIQYANGNKDIIPEEKKELSKTEVEPIKWEPKPMKEQRSKFKNYTTIGGLFTDVDDVFSRFLNISSSIHYQPLPYFSFGISSGVSVIKVSSHVSFRGEDIKMGIPIQGEINIMFSKRRFSPLIRVSSGYLFLTKPIYYADSIIDYNTLNYMGEYKFILRGGPMINCDLGFRILNYNRIGLILTITYRAQYIDYTETETGTQHYMYSFNRSNEKLKYNYMGLNLGITF